MLRQLLLCGSVLALGAGCASSETSDPDRDALAKRMAEVTLAPAMRESRDAASALPLPEQEAFWQGELAKSPADREAAARLANIQRRLGKMDRAVGTASQALALRPNDVELLYELGAAYVGLQESKKAISPLRKAARISEQDWRILSALGAAYDQTGEHETARQFYHQAIEIKHDAASVLNNLGFSYVLSGDPARGEPYLRRALAQPDAAPTTRQNLAAALAMQGRLVEAEKVARGEASPGAVQANLEVLDSIKSNPDLMKKAQPDPLAPAPAPAQLASKPRELAPLDSTPKEIVRGPLAAEGLRLGGSGAAAPAPSALLADAAAEETEATAEAEPAPDAKEPTAKRAVKLTMRGRS